MPLRRGNDRETTEENFREFGKGDIYRRTKARYGKKRADKRRIAVILRNKRQSARRTRRAR
jgi:hypothetical protein